MFEARLTAVEKAIEKINKRLHAIDLIPDPAKQDPQTKKYFSPQYVIPNEQDD